MLAPHTSTAQLSRPDSAIFNALWKAIFAHRLDTLPVGERIAAEGKLFLGTPYVGGTLDLDPSHEHLITNLREFDCVTFYENVLALATFTSSIADKLQDLRYRGGQITDYSSRLHYTTDYFYDAEQKRILKNVTQAIGGALARKEDRTINFMTQHRASYKQLASNDTLFAEMKVIERNMHDRGGFLFIPKSNISKIESKIEPGDILGITTNIPGLDCSHTGIATREADGRIHFMHASSLMGKVIISEEPLAEYLTHSSHQTGIIVMRKIPLGPLTL